MDNEELYWYWRQLEDWDYIRNQSKPYAQRNPEFQWEECHG